MLAKQHACSSKCRSEAFFEELYPFCQCCQHLCHPHLLLLRLHLRPYISLGLLESLTGNHPRSTYSGSKAPGVQPVILLPAKTSRVLNYCSGENLNKEPLKRSNRPLLSAWLGLLDIAWTLILYVHEHSDATVGFLT